MSAYSLGLDMYYNYFHVKLDNLLEFVILYAVHVKFNSPVFGKSPIEIIFQRFCDETMIVHNCPCQI